MSELLNMPWLGRHLTVSASNDHSLVGRKGKVVNETMRTISIIEGESRITLGKASIRFQFEDEDSIIDGSTTIMRPEDRIQRRFGA